MSRPIRISDDFPVESLTGPASAVQPDAVVLDSSSGKFPRPLTDNVKNPATLEANRIVHLKRQQFPAR